MSRHVVLCSLLAFLVTAGSVAVLRRLAVPLGLVAHPGGHRHHTDQVPLIGGIAILLGLAAGVTATGSMTEVTWAWLLGGVFLALVGVIDDWRELPSVVRFLTQGLAAYAMVHISGIWLVDLGRLFSDDVLYLGRWAVPMTIFAAVGVINAMNMSDGMDGLAATMTLVTLACLVLFASLGERALELGLLVITAAAVFAFWLFNARVFRRRPAKVFMGDSGSTLLGWILAWFLIALSQGPERAYEPVIAIWLVALPLFDAVGVLLRRAVRGISPFSADRRHFHHYLLAAGFSVNQVLLIIFTLALALAGVGIVGELGGMSERLLFYMFVGCFVVYVAAMEYLDRATRVTMETVTVEAGPI